MSYTRPTVSISLSKEEKVALMRTYVEYYRRKYAAAPASLNSKIPRSSFVGLTNKIGTLLLKESANLANSGMISKFLRENPLPHSMSTMLPMEIRIFCLALNALKQWVSAEQTAMDKLILGGTARETCRIATSKCIVTGKLLNNKTLKLHHPVRDGRPPLPLSESGHAKIEGQTTRTENATALQKLLTIKRESSHSWVQLRRGCLDLLRRDVKHSTPKVAATSRSFARKAMRVTGLNCEQILYWLNTNGYGMT